MKSLCLERGTGALFAGPRSSRVLLPTKVAPGAIRIGCAIEQRQQLRQRGLVASPRALTAASATGAAAAWPSQPELQTSRIYHVCKSVLIGVAAAAAWSIVASAFSTAASGPFASLSLAAGGASTVGAPMTGHSTGAPIAAAARAIAWHPCAAAAAAATTAPHSHPRRGLKSPPPHRITNLQPPKRPPRAAGPAWPRASSIRSAAQTTWRCAAQCSERTCSPPPPLLTQRMQPRGAGTRVQARARAHAHVQPCKNKQ